VANGADKLAVDVETKLGSDGEKRARFREELAAAKRRVTVRENRAFWQLLSYGSLRVAILRRGQRLVDADAIGQADDVFFLEPEEIDQYLAHAHNSAKTSSNSGVKNRSFGARKLSQNSLGRRPDRLSPS
jgi:hypothetical protein